MIQDKTGLRAITVWPRRNGKDLSALNVVCAKSFQRKGLYLYMAPFYNQVRQIIWEGMDHEGKKFLDYIPPDLVHKTTKLDMRIELINGSQIKLCGSDNIDSIVGSNPVGIVFTEFSLHKPAAWHYLRPILAENGGWALFNGTPRGLNHFHVLFEKAKRNPGWFVQYLTRDDTGYPSLKAIQEDRDSGMPESLIQQEYYCSWTSSSEDVLIPLDIIQPAIRRRIDEDYVRSQARIIGVDVAYAEKGDLAVIARRQGTFLHPLDCFQGLDNMAFASKISKYIQDWHPDIVFVDAGRGEGVISRLHQLGHQEIVIPVHFGGKTYSRLYNRKKDEMWGRMKAWFGNDVHLASVPDDPDLFKDLSTPTFLINDKGYLEIESKRALKARGIPSTDRGDAVALTFAEDVQPRIPFTDRFGREPIDSMTRSIMQAMFRDNGTQKYDPLNYMTEKVIPGFDYITSR
jgi:hypothetical protein